MNPPRTTQRGRPITLPGPVGLLCKEMGGREDLAKETGTNPKTVYRWAHEGRVGSRLLKETLAKLFRRHGITEGVDAFLAASGPRPRGITTRRLKLGEPDPGTPSSTTA